jgi:hypothetical protein
MLEVRRTEPGTRSGAGPTEHRGGAGSASLIVIPGPLRRRFGLSDDSAFLELRDVIP